MWPLLRGDGSTGIEIRATRVIDVTSRKSDGLNHWTLAIGQCDQFIYLLDPAYELPVASCWNAVLSRRPQSNRYGYRYINPWINHDVEVNVMLEIFPR